MLGNWNAISMPNRKKEEGREGFSCDILYWWKFLEGHLDVEAAPLVVGE